MLSLQTIVVPTDFSRCATQAFEYALMLARQLDAEIHLLHVVTEEEPAEDADASAGEQLQGFLTPYDLADVDVEHHLTHGEEPADAVLAYAGEVEADLLVLGSHGRRGLKRLILGSVAEEILRRAPCPAIAACERKEDHIPSAPDDILLPLDLSEHSRAALPAAQSLATTFGARLHLLHVVEDVPLPPAYGIPPTASPSSPTNMEAHAEQALDQVVPETEDLGIQTVTHLGAGIVVPEIVRVVEEQDIDLIVMSSHGRTGLARVLMGSVTEEVLRKAPCPVFVARAFAPPTS